MGCQKNQRESTDCVEIVSRMGQRPAVSLVYELYGLAEEEIKIVEGG
jgi:hypothetical protein